MMQERSDNKWLYVEFPTMGYTDAWNLQTHLVSARHENRVATDVVLMMEHPAVFTVGRRGGLNDLTVSQNFLKKSGIPVIQVERGGRITFHGPGQLIMYPVVDLRAFNITVADYVENLEEVMIRTADNWGIKAERNPLNAGVWVGSNKLGSIGIAIRHGISFHGLALNVNLSLKPFRWINPCGLQGVGVTSMERELSSRVPMSQVRTTIKGHFEAVFGVELVTTRLAELPADCSPISLCVSPNSQRRNVRDSEFLHSEAR